MQPFVFRFRDGYGGVHESDLIECSPEEWAASAESSDPEWSVIRPIADGDGLLRALRLPAALRGRAAQPLARSIEASLGDEDGLGPLRIG